MNRSACFYATLALVLAWGLPSPVWTATARLPVGELVREADLVAVVHVMTVQDLPEMPLAIATLKMRDISQGPAGLCFRVHHGGLPISSGAGRDKPPSVQHWTDLPTR